MLYWGSCQPCFSVMALSDWLTWDKGSIRDCCSCLPSIDSLFDWVNEKGALVMDGLDNLDGSRAVLLVSESSSTGFGGAAIIRSNINRLTFCRASNFWSPISKITCDRSSGRCECISFPGFDYLDLR